MTYKTDFFNGLVSSLETALPEHSVYRYRSNPMGSNKDRMINVLSTNTSMREDNYSRDTIEVLMMLEIDAYEVSVSATNSANLLDETESIIATTAYDYISNFAGVKNWNIVRLENENDAELSKPLAFAKLTLEVAFRVSSNDFETLVN